MERFLAILFIFGICLPTQLVAQDRVSEQEVSLQKMFIDANRERILGNYENAERLYKEVLKQDKKNHVASYELGRIYEATGANDKAIKVVKNAMEMDPSNEWYAKFLANLYQKVGNDEQAAEIYEELVNKYPDNEFYYFKLAYFLVRSNDISKALKVYDELEKRTGITEEIIRRKHTLYMGTGNNKKAAKELERLIDAFPNQVDYRHLLANFYEQLEEFSEAKKIYESIIEIDPDDVKANLALAGASTKSNDNSNYLEALKPIFQQTDVNIDLKMGKLIPFINDVASSGDQALASDLLELTDILEVVHPEEAKVYSAAGDILFYSGNRSKAKEKYERTLELDETVYLVWEQLLYTYLEEKAYEKLLERSEDAMDIFPNKASLYYLNGVAANELEQYQEALDMLDQALLMSGRNGQLQYDVQSQLGITYFELKKYDRSYEAFEEALKLNPKAPEVLNNYSYYLASRGEQLAKALTMAETLNELVRNDKNYQDTYAWVLYRMGKFEKSKKWLEDALRNGGDTDPEVLEHYGDVLFKLSEVDKAIEYWKKAQENGSESELLEKKIADRQLYE